MNAQIFSTRPVKAAVSGFLGLSGVALAVGIATRMGVIDDAGEKRAIGLIIGAMALIVGNFLPKTRPLKMLSDDSAKTLAFEHLSGGILVLTGIVYIVLFAFMPLDQARPLSAITGIGTIVVIAANWMRLAPLPGFRMIREAAKNKRITRQGWLMINLLFAFFWVFATACAKFLLTARSWDDAFKWWITLGFFCSLYAVLLAALKPRRCTL